MLPGFFVTLASRNRGIKERNQQVKVNVKFTLEQTNEWPERE